MPPPPPYADDELAPCCMYWGGGGPACMLIAMDRLSCRAWYCAAAHRDRVSVSRARLVPVRAGAILPSSFGACMFITCRS